jgi:hypothetical protein
VLGRAPGVQLTFTVTMQLVAFGAAMAVVSLATGSFGR